MSARAVLRFDGACWPRNPGGHAAWGLSLEGGEFRRNMCGYLGQGQGMTNNVAEYHALLNGMELARGMGFDDLAVQGDSELVINQMLGRYKCKAELLVPLYQRARIFEEDFASVGYKWTPREANSQADGLSRCGLAMRLKKYEMVLSDATGFHLVMDVVDGVVDGEPLKGVPVGQAMEQADKAGMEWLLREPEVGF